jgi:hypothetical protein
MQKKIALAAAILGAATSFASAQPVDWQGGGVLSDIVNCPSGNLNDPTFVTARFRPADVGDNGDAERLSLFRPFYSTNIAVADGPFPSAFRAANGSFIATGVGKYRPRVRVTEQTPAVIDENTPQIHLKGQIRNFSGLPGNEDCRVNFNILIAR